MCCRLINDACGAAWLCNQQDVLNGFNGTVMAYGQTGAGKTYTLSAKHPTAHGIITAIAGFKLQNLPCLAHHHHYLTVLNLCPIINLSTTSPILPPDPCS
jgi:hypothetical protein